MAHKPELPNEVWLETLTYLDYIDLKICTRVGKTFKSILSSAAFDEALFRSKVVTDLPIDPKKTRLHPVLPYLSYGCTNDIDDVTIGDVLKLLKETSVAGEHATSPPVKYLRVQIHRWRKVGVQNKNGVTVLQAMKAVCKFFGRTHKYGQTRADEMGDHTCWTGFNYVEVDPKGRLLLRAVYFDS